MKSTLWRASERRPAAHGGPEKANPARECRQASRYAGNEAYDVNQIIGRLTEPSA